MDVPNDPVDTTLWGSGAEAPPFESRDMDDDFELDGEGLKDAFGLPDRLPPVRLPAEPELPPCAGPRRCSSGRASSPSGQPPAATSPWKRS
jgi:hypothetical protein